MINQLIHNLAQAERSFPNGVFHHGRSRQHDLLRSDIVETDTAYKLNIDAPGIARDKIDVQLENSILTVAVTFEEGKELQDDKARTHLNERVAGKFERRFRVPQKISKEDVKAKIKNGVLSINLAKPDPEKVREETQIVVS